MRCSIFLNFYRTYKGIVDESTQKGRYILTGSQNFSLNHHISSVSLRSHCSMVTLLPLSLSELKVTIDAFTSIFKGGYPILHNLNMYPFRFLPKLYSDLY